MRNHTSSLARRIASSTVAASPKAFPTYIQAHLAELAEHFSYTNCRAASPATRSFATTRTLHDHNRVQPSVRRPADFHALLQSASSTNTLLLALFKTSTCHSCSTITPLLEELVKSRPQPSVGDKFGSIAFTELELDSPERDEGGGTGWTTMYDVGIEYGVRTVPTLIGFGGRRAERVTDRLANENQLKDRHFMQEWIDEVMKRGDPHPRQGTGILARIFGGGS